MKRRSLAFRLRWIVPVVAAICGSLAPSARADLTQEISAVLHDKLLQRAEESIEIVRLGATAGNAQIVYRHDSEIPQIPASNLKLLITSAALDKLGPGFHFKTQLVFHDGDLCLIGDGDPTFGDAELLTRVGWNVTTVFQNWAAGLKKLNLPGVRNVIVDDSIFEEKFIHPNWPLDHDQWLKRYEAEVAGMNLNANCLDVYMRVTTAGQPVNYVLSPDTRYVTLLNSCLTGGENSVWLARTNDTNLVTMRGTAPRSTEVPVSVTIHDPPMYAATVLAETLEAAGIKHTGDVRRDRTIRQQLAGAQARGDKTWGVLAVHETGIEQAMARANKDSMNLYAECLCKRLGAEVSGQTGTWQNGDAAVSDFLKKLGVPDTEFKLDDGCGLSKENRISAAGMVKVLQYDFFCPASKTFMTSLSIAGIDGTLDDRFRGTDLRGRVLGKSGFVNGVSCLSGYLHARDGNWYAFSILMNGIPEKSNSAIKALQEKIVRAVDAHSPEVATIAR